MYQEPTTYPEFKSDRIEVELQSDGNGWRKKAKGYESLKRVRRNDERGEIDKRTTESGGKRRKKKG
ncbi:hypothetical protein E6C27_scaffold501G001190 [Cucumis melo var. makuwa]|nr:hypothetical protein E6C27_scaffold501G001190 [Cucumis melo var. makuwa]